MFFWKKTLWNGKLKLVLPLIINNSKSCLRLLKLKIMPFCLSSMVSSSSWKRNLPKPTRYTNPLSPWAISCISLDLSKLWIRNSSKVKNLKLKFSIRLRSWNLTNKLSKLKGKKKKRLPSMRRLLLSPSISRWIIKIFRNRLSLRTTPKTISSSWETFLWLKI